MWSDLLAPFSASMDRTRSQAAQRFELHSSWPSPFLIRPFCRPPSQFHEPSSSEASHMLLAGQSRVFTQHSLPWLFLPQETWFSIPSSKKPSMMALPDAIPLSCSQSTPACRHPQSPVTGRLVIFPSGCWEGRFYHLVIPRSSTYRSSSNVCQINE